MKFTAIPLLPLSLLYGGVMRLRNWAYDRGWMRSYAVEVPVISIGNITVGGTGKTPMAEFLLASLCAMGYTPTYLSRGYGRLTKGYLWVDPNVSQEEAGLSAAERYGDEAYQVATRFPNLRVAVCEDRVAGAQRLLQEHPADVLVLDDAFQHRRIRRDLDLVMIDTTRMPTRDWPFPAGRMREALRGLRRAQVLVLSKWANAGVLAAAESELRTRFPAQLLAAFDLQPTGVAPFFADPFPGLVDGMSVSGRQDELADARDESSVDLSLEPEAHGSLSGGAPSAGLRTGSGSRFDEGSRFAVSELRGMAVLAFSGIGNNAHFRSTLEAQGAQVIEHLHFPDHHRYTEADLDKILATFEAEKEIKGKLRPAWILTTEKDFFRLKTMPWMTRFAHLPLAYVTVGMVPQLGWPELEVELKKIIKRDHGKYQ